MRKAIVALFTGILFSFPSLVSASTYGEGKYGSGNYNEGEVTTTVPATVDSPLEDNSTETPTCRDEAVGVKTPWLYGAIATSASTVTLYFTPADSPVTKYVLKYGTQSDEYKYGVDDLGVNSRAQMTYSVNALSPNTLYYFRVRGQNGCATGEWSNEISVRTKDLITFNQLDFTDSDLALVVSDTKPSTCEPYTVKSGDSLWAIAQSLLGDGNQYKEIVAQNKEAYPSLASSNNLSAGWELRVGCDEIKEEMDSEEVSQSEGLQVNVKVTDTKQQPVKGAKVTLHSDPKEAITGADGVAKFSGVEEGEHKVLISYQNYEGEQSIYLTATETQKEFNLNITIEQKGVLFSTQVKLIIGTLSLIIVILVTYLFKAKRS